MWKCIVVFSFCAGILLADEPASSSTSGSYYISLLARCKSDPGCLNKDIRDTCYCYFDGAYTDGHPNGRWWRETPSGKKLDFLFGFFEGLRMAGFAPNASISAAELADWLDAFYHDRDTLTLPIGSAIKIHIGGVATPNGK